MTDWLPLLCTAAASLAAVAFWHWVVFILLKPGTSGDSICMAYWLEGQPVPPPYCWRPLLPLLVKWTGGRWWPISHTASFLTPLVAYGFAGGGWTGFAIGLCFIGNIALIPFNVRWPDYVEGLGHLLFIGSLWAIAAHQWPAAALLVALGMLCRESIGLSLMAVCAAYALAEPWALVGVLAGGLAGAAAYFLRNENEHEHHPLTEDTRLDTMRKWMHKKGEGKAAYHWATVIQPLRGLPLVIPFVWDAVPLSAQVALVAFLPLWFLSLPASGVGRHMAYGFGLCVPFVAALPAPWVWTLVLLSWFWPFHSQAFDETGGTFVGLRKTAKGKAREAVDAAQAGQGQRSRQWSY